MLPLRSSNRLRSARCQKAGEGLWPPQAVSWNHSTIGECGLKHGDSATLHLQQLHVSATWAGRSFAAVVVGLLASLAMAPW